MLKIKFIKVIGALAIVAAGIGCAYYFLIPAKLNPSTVEQVQIPTEKIPTQLESVQVKSIAPDKAKLDLSKADPSKPITIEGKSYLLFSPADVAELQNWLGDRGYFNKQDREVYDTYTTEVLQDLGKKGDIMALNVLTNRAVKNADERAATIYMNLAVIYGSTAELDGLTIYTSPRSTNDATEETRRPHALETLAVTQVIALRGDKSLSAVSKRGFVNSYKNLYGVDLVLTPEEEVLVANRAQEIYNKFQALRHARGLGDFDNSEPSSVKNFFGLK